jgi:uncharacterized protein DUF5985
MMATELIAALQAVAATAAWTAGLFFFRFWRDTRERLFLFFSVTFWFLSLSWLVLALFDPTDEARPYIYALRLVAFLTIIGAFIDANCVKPRPR